MSLPDDFMNDEKPPLFRSWRGWYWLVLTTLGLIVLLLYLITLRFA